MSSALPAYLGIDERQVTIVHPNDRFDVELSVEPAVLKKTLHREIKDLMQNWSIMEIVEKYGRIHTQVDLKVLQSLLTTDTKFARYCGSDLIYTKHDKMKEFLMIESNVFTAGQDAMPPSSKVYESVLNWSVLNAEWQSKPTALGGLAHMYGKKTRRDYAYPHTMTRLVNEPIHVTPLFSKGPDDKIELLVRFVDGTMQIKSHDKWINIRACFHTMSYRPWAYIPVTNNLKTYIYPHPIVGLVGKNKILSEYAYRDFDGRYSKHGIQIRRPRTIVGITKKDIRDIVEKKFNGRAVIKTPYDGQGRGVYVIRNEKDLDYFYATDRCHYSLWVVQELIGVEGFPTDRYEQVGYSFNGKLYACSLRIIACNSPHGFKMSTICGARAPASFSNVHRENGQSCLNSKNKQQTVHEDDVYVTNIGPYQDGELRSFYADDVGIAGMGIGIDDVVDGIIQTVYTVHAIENMCNKLTTEEGELNLQMLKELNPDPQLLAELITNWK